MKIGNSVLAGNGNFVLAGNGNDFSPDTFGPIASLGFNFVGITNGSSGFGAFGDQVGRTGAALDPMLGPLQDNGSLVPTMLPLPGSPLIGASDDGSDIGAAEHQPVPVMPATPLPPNGPGSALSFDGINDYLTAAPAGLPTGNSAYTIEAWIKPDTMHVGGLAAWGNYGANNQVNAFALTPTGLVNYWWANDLWATTADLAGAWHHVAATFDGTTRRILLDGVVVASDTPVGHNATAANFRIGLANTGQYFDGQLDEVRIWSVARTAAQIQAAMRRQLFGNESGLVAYYRFDENGGLSAFDSTGNANNSGMLVNGPVWVRSTLAPFAPFVTTLAASDFTGSSMRLNCLVDGRSADSTYEVYFQWGNTPSLGNELRLGYTIPAASAPQTFSFPLTGLVPTSTYYFRAVAANGISPSYGATLTFQRPCANPTGLPTTLGLTLEPGLHAIANNFQIGGNTLGEVLPNVAEGSFIHVYTPGAGFSSTAFDFGAWNHPSLPVPAGAGMFLQTPSRQTLTFHGAFQAGAACPRSRLPEGGYLVGNPLPKASTFEEFMGFPPEAGDTVFLYGSPIDTSTWTKPLDVEKAQSVHTYLAAGWDAAPVLPTGRAAWVKLAPQRLRLLIAKPNQARLTAIGPPGSSWLIESRPVLGAQPNWQALTRITLPASGSLVVENNAAGVSRFYRGVRVVYANDFEGAVGPEWSAPQSVSTTPVGGRKFLGEFSRNVVSLLLRDLPPHTRLRVSFDLFVLKSWDGNRTDFGPDTFQLSVRNGPTLLLTTFSNYDPTQGYPGTLTDNYPPKTGAIESNTLGYTHANIGPADSVYRLSATLNHNASTAIFDFAGVNLQDISDESWGLDNVRVEAIHVP